MKDIKGELDTLIRARYPIINLRTFEEARAEKLIAEVVREQSKEDGQPLDLLIWSCTQGLRCVIGNTQPESTNDPLSVLDVIEKYQNPGVIILRDYHKFLVNNTVEIFAVRKLRDIYDELKESYKTVILLSPTMTIPLELSKCVTPLELPLPGKQELNTVLETLMPSVKAAAGEEVARRIDEALHNGNRDAILSAGLGFTGDEYQAALKRTLIDTESLDIPTIIKEKEQIIKKSGVLEYYSDLSDLTDVGGHDALKSWILKRKKAFTPAAREYGLPQPKGVFLTGVAGTGKSLLAKATAKYFQMPLLRLDAGKLYASHVGESEQNMGLALELAEAIAPSILWIDEVEKVFAGSLGSGDLDSGVTLKVVGKFLTWAQEHRSPVFTVVTCNDPNKLPPEFMRAGRFDETFFVDLPTKEERQDIFKIHIAKMGRDPGNYEIQDFAQITDGYSGAEIESIVKSAMFDAYDEGRELTSDHIRAAIPKTNPLSKKRPEEIKAMRKWGEEYTSSSSGAKAEAGAEAPKQKISFKKGKSKGAD